MGERLEVGVLDGWRRRGWKIAVWLCLGIASGYAQRPQPAAALADADTTTALLEMAGRAGLIFAGHVVSITRNDTAGFVDVRFAIDQPVSGCPPTGEYGVREWAGLWAGNASRYQAGQRFLMMLHLPGPSGMSAPVGGLNGAIPLLASGVGPVMDATGSVPADTGPGPLSGLAVDLRWVQAAALRQGTATSKRPTNATTLQATGSIDSTAVGGPIATTTPSIGAATQVTLESVLAVLRGVGSANR
jgi:hypothetical protein